MIDLETLGTRPDTVVLSLGAVAFNKTGILKEGLWTFKKDEQIEFGRTRDADTLEWWSNQSESAQAVLHGSDFDVTLSEYFDEFQNWIKEPLEQIGEDFDQLKPWGCGANFDISIMEDLHRSHDKVGEFKTPWDFWNVRCFRTFKELTRCDQLVLRKGTHHDALDDARYQAECVLHILQGKHKGNKK